jgi:hypothetical protein
LRTLLIILFPVILFSCSNERPYPWLAGLDSKEGFEESGRNLMAESGCTEDELRSVTGHQSRDVLSIYVRPTDKLAQSGISRRFGS